MVKKNYASMGNQVCPCQDTTEFGLANPLVEVKERHEYERKQEHNEWGKLVSGPSIPETSDGIAIVRENFPDCNFVCPDCGEEWLAIVDIYPLSEKGDRPENTFTDEDWETVERALEMHIGFNDDESAKETLDKVKGRV